MTKEAKTTLPPPDDLLLEEVYAALAERHEPFGGLSVRAPAAQIRAALLVLQSQGRANLRYGYGWRKV